MYQVNTLQAVTMRPVRLFSQLGVLLVLLIALLLESIAYAASPEWSERFPKWSPDGNLIAFASSREGNMDIFVANADGSDMRRLTSDSALFRLVPGRSPTDTWPTWSPDSKSIAFMSGRDNDRLSYVLMNIYSIDLAGGKPRRISGPEGGDQPAWSPDGQWIAFSNDPAGKRDIYVMRDNGTNITQVTHDGGLNDQPAWSPDGKQIAFTSKRTGVSNIFVVSSNGNNLQQLTMGNKSSGLPSWSPDGKRIAFISDRDTAAFEIYVMDSDGKNVTRLTFDGGNSMPSWSPDGKRIVYASMRSGKYRIYVMDADGDNKAKLLRD